MWNSVVNMDYSHEQIDAIQSFMHEKRMSDETTRGYMRQMEKLAKYASREAGESLEVNFLERGLHWWADRIKELELYYDASAECELIKSAVFKVGYVADRDPPQYEVRCRFPGCRRMKDFGKKCWWCGN